MRPKAVAEEGEAGGARETAFASMRCGSSRTMGGRCRFGRSLDSGDDQPGCDIIPQCGVPLLVSILSSPSTTFTPTSSFLVSLGLPSHPTPALLSSPSLTSRPTLLGASPFSSGFQLLGTAASVERDLYSRPAQMKAAMMRVRRWAAAMRKA